MKLFGGGKLPKLKMTEADKQKKLSTSLKSEQQKSAIIIDSIEDGVVLVGQDLSVQLFNPAAAKITGWTQEEAIGLDFKNVLQLIDEHDHPYEQDNNPLLQTMQTISTIRDSNAILITRAGKKIALSISASPLIDESSNNVTGAVAVFRDVSKERAEEKQRADFISTASHEMRTPIAAIDGYLALALNEKVSKLDPAAKDYITKARAATQHLGTLFQDLLTSSKAEDGRLSNYPRVVEMGELLAHITEDSRFNAEKKGLAVLDPLSSNTEAVRTTVRPLYFVHVDPDRIREVLQNLIDNAIKYTPEGSIAVNISGDDSIVQIRISDTGPGITPEDLPHLFQKFYRIDNSMTRTIGGTGLGLFISRKIVELYNGRIWAESEIGKGTTFFVNLPRISSEKATELKAQEKDPNLVLPQDKTTQSS